MAHLVPPIVNLNGTSREELLDQQLDVLKAIQVLINAMLKASPHARDFQPRPQEYIPAREAWRHRVDALIKMKHGAGRQRLLHLGAKAYIEGMTDLPPNLAQACEAWARLEAHLIEYCGLGQGALLERERPALIRLVVAALDGSLPAPAPVPAPTVPLFEPPASQPPAVRPVARIGEAVWFSGYDLPAPDLAGARTDGPGFDCRGCGMRVRRGRHVDPRLLCQACMTSATASNP